MSEQLICCKNQLKKFDVFILKDIKDFTARKLFVATCPFCSEKSAILVEKRIADEKVFVNNFGGIEAVKTIYREKKRVVAEFPDIKADGLYGWVYGINVQIKNKKGIVVQQRQYAGDFFGNRKKVKSQTIS